MEIKIEKEKLDIVHNLLIRTRKDGAILTNEEWLALDSIYDNLIGIISIAKQNYNSMEMELQEEIK